MFFKTFSPQETLPPKVITPRQVHGDNIVEIITGEEDLADTDGLFTKDDKFLLGIKTADCAPIIFIGQHKFGIIHVGWRGLCGQICEKMQELFAGENPQIYCGPFLAEFEIKKDFCYEQIEQKFGEQFFTFDNGRIIFRFKDAIAALLPKIVFDSRNTFVDPKLASWRRDHIEHRSNVTVVGLLTKD